jgi:serine phosphatase RsbU (regulator of sigma subunit)
VSEPPAFPPSYAIALDTLLRRSYLVAPDRVCELVAEAARGLGATETVVYLVDYEQSQLVPTSTPEGDTREPLKVDATLAGTAFRRVTHQVSQADGARRLWMPLLDGVERLGVVEYLLPDDDSGGGDVDPLLISMLHQFTHLAAELLISKMQYTDAYEWTRRRQPMELATEMQYELLPPLTFGAERLVISGLLAPAYEVGGDAFDYALNGNIAHVAVFDAMGHGLLAAQLSGLAVGSYRSARRAGLDLAHTAQAVDAALRAQHGGERFVTALLGQLDVDTGRFRWLSAGHPGPLLLRGSKVVGTLTAEPCQPLGLLDLGGGGPPPVQEESLQPGDRLLLFTDGVEEARGRDGSFFGMQRLAEFVARQAASGEPTPEMMRRLQRAVLDHQEGHLQDDATTLFVEWLTGDEHRLETP